VPRMLCTAIATQVARSRVSSIRATCAACMCGYHRRSTAMKYLQCAHGSGVDPTVALNTNGSIL